MRALLESYTTDADGNPRYHYEDQATGRQFEVLGFHAAGYAKEAAAPRPLLAVCELVPTGRVLGGWGAAVEEPLVLKTNTQPNVQAALLRKWGVDVEQLERGHVPGLKLRKLESLDSCAHDIINQLHYAERAKPPVAVDPALVEAEKARRAAEDSAFAHWQKHGGTRPRRSRPLFMSDSQREMMKAIHRSAATLVTMEHDARVFEASLREHSPFRGCSSFDGLLLPEVKQLVLAFCAAPPPSKAGAASNCWCWRTTRRPGNCGMALTPMPPCVEIRSPGRRTCWLRWTRLWSAASGTRTRCVPRSARTRPSSTLTWPSAAKPTKRSETAGARRLLLMSHDPRSHHR